MNFLTSGYKTTEFWISLFATVGILAGAISGVMPGNLAAIAASISAGAYAISRGLAKQSSSTVVMTPQTTSKGSK